MVRYLICVLRDKCLENGGSLVSVCFYPTPNSFPARYVLHLIVCLKPSTKLIAFGLWRARFYADFVDHVGKPADFQSSIAYPLQRRGWSRGRRCWGIPGSTAVSRVRQRRAGRGGSRRRYRRWHGRRRTRARSRRSPPGLPAGRPPRPPPTSGTDTPSAGRTAACSPERTAATTTTPRTRTAPPAVARTPPSHLHANNKFNSRVCLSDAEDTEECLIS
jgi:hypothetical protein